MTTELFKIAESVSDSLLGTSDSVEKVLEQMGLSDKVSEDDIIDEICLRIERCPTCEWWCECGELVDEDGDETDCDSCGNNKID